MIRGWSVSSVPLDVWLGAGLVGGSGLVFLLAGVLRWLTEGGVGVLAVPAAVCVLEVGVAAALLAGFRPARPVGQVVVALVALVHLVIALGGGYLWTRLLSMVLVAVAVFALVMLNSRPVREYFGGRG